VRTPLGSTTTYNRDAAGRPSSVVLPWGAQKTYAYTDADTLPETVTLQQGTTLSYAYDSAKREVSRTSSAGESRSFVYGAGDRLQSMIDATGTTRYSYDTQGRFAGITYPHGGSVSYQRDLLGRVILPYEFAWGNPLVLSDPTGRSAIASVGEASLITVLHTILASINTARLSIQIGTIGARVLLAATAACVANHALSDLFETASGAPLPPGVCRGAALAHHYTEVNAPVDFKVGARAHTWWTDVYTPLASVAAIMQVPLGLKKPGASRLPPEWVVTTQRDSNFRLGIALPNTTLKQWFNNTRIPFEKLVIQKLL